MMLRRCEILILGVIILGLLVWLVCPKSPGRSVLVTVDGRETGRYSLSEDLETGVEGYAGFHLKLVIHGGVAYVEESTCPDLICQHHAPISNAGEQIICLPGRIVISVTGKEADVDAVTR